MSSASPILAPGETQIWKIVQAVRALQRAGQQPGIAIAQDAQAGNVGEYIASVIASGSAVSLSNGTPANMTSISLTPGDWDVCAQFTFALAVTTVVMLFAGSVSLGSATLDATNGRLFEVIFPSGFTPGGGDMAFNVQPVRFSLNAATTIYATVQANFSTSTCSVFGLLRARRVR